MKFSVLAAAGAAAILTGCAGVQPTPAGRATAPPPPSLPADASASATAKHILLFVGDGMGINTLTAARTFAVGEDGDLTLDTLPESAFVKTYSNDMQVSDSAAAMSAYMTGVKTSNGVLAMSDCGNAARPEATLLELARQRGWSAGVVSTASVTDPLSAAAYAHGCKGARDEDIAAALVPGGAGHNAALAGGLDVVLGGGAQHFSKRADGRDLLAELRANGYAHTADGAALAAYKPAAGQRLVGLFNQEALSFASAREAAREPTLTQMTTRAIDVLSQNGKGFMLVVGNGLIDRALHVSNARRALEETVALDGALKSAIEQMRRIDPGLKNTLVVITSNHDSTLILNGYSIRTGKTTATEPGVLGLVRRYSDGKYYKDLDGAPYTIIGFGNGVNRVQGSRGAAPALTDAVVSAPDYRQEAVVRMAPDATTHGGTDVYLGAIGARAGDFRGTIENTNVNTLIKNAAGW